MSKITEMEIFIEELDREAYEVGAGLKDEANFSAIFDRMDKLISAETIAEIRDTVENASERAEYLSFLLCMIIDKSVKRLNDEVITTELELTLDAGAGIENVPFRQLPVMIANEPDHAERGRLDALRRDVYLERLNGKCVEIMKKTYEVVKGFGYESYVDFFEKVEGVSLDEMVAQADNLLDSTLDIYKRELEYYCETFLKMPAGELAQYDLSYMRRAELFDGLFPADKLLQAAWDTMDNMGIQAKDHPHVHLDVEKRDRKSPRAFCCPVRVPDEVYLVIMPHGGVDDYSSFLHELGHTLHYAHTNANLSLAARCLGDNSVTEAHAGTLEHLIFNPEWLSRRLGVDDSADYLRFMEFFELYMLRRYCAKLKYETQLHGGKIDVEDCADVYAKTLTTATLVEYDPAFYLSDLDSHFYCVRYLRSWMFERQIRDVMEKKFGVAWFDDQDAGKLLLQMWSKGQEYKADAMSIALGYDSLNFDAIIRDYSQS